MFKHAPEMTIDPKATYTATMETSCGTIEMVYPDVAPIGVNNFVFLSKQGYFDGLTFHRIVKGFALQGGDPLGNGTGGPGYQFPNEIDKSLTFGKPGRGRDGELRLRTRTEASGSSRSARTRTSTRAPRRATRSSAT